MILTYKIKHDRDFSVELAKARQVAEFVLVNGLCTSARVKHIGLKSVIANQIIRKYGRNKKLKGVSNVNLTVPNQGIKLNRDKCEITIPCLKLTLCYGDITQLHGFTKVNQVELSEEYAFVSVSVEPEQAIIGDNPSWIGIDLNATGHCVVASNPISGKVIKLGKRCLHIRNKYKNQRRKLQKKRKYKLIKKIKNRESRIIRDINHKISRKIIDWAKDTNSGIALEDLSGIRQRTKNKQAKSFRYALNSWTYYQLQMFLEYKAKLLGIPIVKINAAYTSQQCSCCGLLGDRNKKSFKCHACGHVDNADVNASFCIALRHQGILQFPVDRDTGKGSTDTPKRQLRERRRP